MIRPEYLSASSKSAMMKCFCVIVLALVRVR